MYFLKDCPGWRANHRFLFRLYSLPTAKPKTTQLLHSTLPIFFLFCRPPSLAKFYDMFHPATEVKELSRRLLENYWCCLVHEYCSCLTALGKQLVNVGVGWRHSTEVALGLLTELSQVRFMTFQFFWIKFDVAVIYWQQHFLERVDSAKKLNSWWNPSSTS